MIRPLFVLVLGLSLSGLTAKAADFEVNLTRSKAGMQYIFDNGGAVSKHTYSLTPKGFTPKQGENTPFWKFYDYWTVPNKLHPQGEYVASDRITSRDSVYKVTNVKTGSFQWYCLSDTLAISWDPCWPDTYVNTWSFLAGTVSLYDLGTTDPASEPYWNPWYGDVLEAGWGQITIEEFETQFYTP